MGKFKKNEVKCDIGSYMHYWRGLKKSGKTTLFYDLIKAQYGDLNKGLLISVGDEIGYQALDGLVYAEAPTWDELIEVIDELVENKSENEFELVAIDTVDEAVKLAMEEVKAIHRRTHNGERKEFNACLGGYGAPRQKVTELLDEQIARLRRAGYGVVFIGHTRLKDIKEKNGDEYQQLTSNLSADYDGIFANKADIVMTIVVEKEIDENKHISGTNRFMYFRSDGFVDAGGRFANMPERIEYGAKNYLMAFEQGVKGAMNTELSDKKFETKRKAEVEERKEKGAAYAVDAEANKINVSRNKEIIDAIKKASGNAKLKEIIRPKLKEYGASSYADLENVPTAKMEQLYALVTNEVPFEEE